MCVLCVHSLEYEKTGVCANNVAKKLGSSALELGSSLFSKVKGAISKDAAVPIVDSCLRMAGWTWGGRFLDSTSELQ